MLSNDLQSLRDFLNKHRAGGVALRAATVQSLVENLDVAIADAEALEACYVLASEDLTTASSQVVEISDIPGTVASLAAFRGRRAQERFLIPVCRSRSLPDRPDGAA